MNPLESCKHVHYISKSNKDKHKNTSSEDNNRSVVNLFNNNEDKKELTMTKRIAIAIELNIIDHNYANEKSCKVTNSNTESNSTNCISHVDNKKDEEQVEVLIRELKTFLRFFLFIICCNYQ
jgi:hypothetical protein